MDTFLKASLAAAFADDKKAEEISVLDVRGLCTFTDSFIICTGRNRVQLNAIGQGIAEGLKKRGVKNPVEDGMRESNWRVLDYGDLVIHIMTSEARNFYRLERLWGDAKEVDWVGTATDVAAPAKA